MRGRHRRRQPPTTVATAAGATAHVHTAASVPVQTDEKDARQAKAQVKRRRLDMFVDSFSPEIGTMFANESVDTQMAVVEVIRNALQHDDMEAWIHWLVDFQDDDITAILKKKKKSDH